MKYILLFLMIFLFNACSIKSYKHTSSKIITIKSPKIKFSDLGFIRNTGDAIELELFVAGNTVEKISINHLICIRDGCMSKSGFNKEYLHSSYPDEIMQNILLGKKIFKGENTIKTDEGYEQIINTQNVNIVYKVSSELIYFKDKQNGILLKVKGVK